MDDRTQGQGGEARTGKSFDDLTKVQLTAAERAAVATSLQTLPARWRTVEMSRLLGTVLRDPGFAPRLRANPRKYFSMYCGIDVPEWINIAVHPHEEDTIHLVLPNPNPAPAHPEAKGPGAVITDADLVSDFAYAKARDLTTALWDGDDNTDRRDSRDDPGGWKDGSTDDGGDAKDAKPDKKPAD